MSVEKYFEILSHYVNQTENDPDLTPDELALLIAHSGGVDELIKLFIDDIKIYEI